MVLPGHVSLFMTIEINRNVFALRLNDSRGYRTRQRDSPGDRVGLIVFGQQAEMD